jgi:hypothetical protein
MLLPTMFTFFVMLYASSVSADEIKCGEMPLIADESLKAEIQGKARLLSRYLGDAALAGQIETSRKDIFAKYPDAQKSRADAALEYQMCEYLKRDKTHSDFEKFKILREMRGAFLQKQSEIEKGYESPNAAERSVAIRNAFEAISVFGVRLEPIWNDISEGNKYLYLSMMSIYENKISKPVGYYSRETGKFNERKDGNARTDLKGHVSGQSRHFGGHGCTGNLVNTGTDWIFTGLVSCGQYKYKGVLQLR